MSRFFKIRLAFMSCLLGLLLLMGCGSGAGGSGSTYSVKLGHATVGDAQDEIANYFVAEMERLSNGRITGDVYNGSQLGDNAQMNKAVQSGTQEAIIQPTGFMAPIVPELGALDLPFLFPDDEVQTRVLNSEATQKIRDLAEAKDQIIVGFMAGGFKNFSSTFPIEKAEDIKGRKFRTITSPELVGQFESWGAIGVPMALGEVYTGLQQGTIEGLENPADVLFNLNLHEAAKYFTLTEHGGLTTVLVVSKSWYHGLPADLQEVVMEAGQNSAEKALEVYKAARDKAMDGLRAAGTNISTLPPDELEKLKQMTETVWAEARKDPLKNEIIDSISEAIERLK